MTLGGPAALVVVIVVVFNRGLYRSAVVFFDEKPNLQGIDIAHYLQRSGPVENGRCREFHTRLIDLLRSEDDLLADVRKDTRYEIRRAQDRDGVKCGRIDAHESGALERFRLAYDRFASEKKLAPSDGRVLEGYWRGGVLQLARAIHSDGRELVWHAYVVSSGRARLLHSASILHSAEDRDLRSLIGRANRLLHWFEMTSFKADGLGVYEHGGWSDYTNDDDKARINQFKESFGGHVVREFNCVQAISRRGWAVVAAQRLHDRWTEFRTTTRS